MPSFHMMLQNKGKTVQVTVPHYGAYRSKEVKLHTIYVALGNGWM
jgi:hypothetical protein